MSWAMEMVTGIMQDRIRVSPRDAFGIIFYNTVSEPWGRLVIAVCLHAPCSRSFSPMTAAGQGPWGRTMPTQPPPREIFFSVRAHVPIGGMVHGRDSCSERACPAPGFQVHMCQS